MMAAGNPCTFAPEDLARLKERLAALVEEYLRESDPKVWTQPTNAAAQTRRFYEKRNAEVLLKQVTELSRTIAAAEGVPQPRGTPASKATTATVKAAREKAKALREAAGIDDEVH